jgi:phosphoribosylanthranilate isomerase
MDFLVKICGITNLADARYCAGAGADMLGFIQHKESPRYVTPGTVQEINDWLYGPEMVGVFVNESADTVNRIADEAGFTMVQLHGTESVETCQAIERPVIKAFPVVHDAASDHLRPLIAPYRDVVDYVLLDTASSSVWGGTGESFNWRLVRELTDEFPVLLAGGIGADNVAEAVNTMQPRGIDLASSVEQAPGRKDFDKLADLFDAVDALRAEQPQQDEPQDASS